MYPCQKAETSRVKNLGQSGTFLTTNAKRAFTKLRQAFVEALILNHFDLERHIRIEMDTLGYAIGGIFNQLTLNDLDQWHLVAFFFRKMIPAKTRYKTNNRELLAIVKMFKTWRHYLKSYKHEVLMFIDHNNLQCFIDTKSLSSRQVR